MTHMVGLVVCFCISPCVRKHAPTLLWSLCIITRRHSVLVMRLEVGQASFDTQNTVFNSEDGDFPLSQISDTASPIKWVLPVWCLCVVLRLKLYLLCIDESEVGYMEKKRVMYNCYVLSPCHDAFMLMKDAEIRYDWGMNMCRG